MAETRWHAGRRGLPAIALILLVTGSLLLIGRSSLWPSGDPRPNPKTVLDLPNGEVVGGVAVGESVVVILSEEDSAGGGVPAGEGRTTLLRLDPATGTEQERVVLGSWPAMDELVEVDGDLVLRLRGRLPGVPGILLPAAEFEEAASFDDEVWLVVIDGTTLTPIRQYQLPPFQDTPRSEQVSEPLVVIDGVYWMLGAGSRRARIDLRSGETWFARDVFARPVSGVVAVEERVVVIAWGIVRIIDRATGEIVARYQTEDYLRMMDAAQPVDFRAHENQVWVTPLVRDVEDLPLRLDLDTGELVDDRPSTPIPGLAFESGGSRWELTGRRVVATERRSPVPESGDRWRQVDPETNEMLAVFDLGSWRPVFATQDHLWVTGIDDDRPGSHLARIPLR